MRKVTREAFVEAIKSFKLPGSSELDKLFDYMNPWRKYRDLTIEFYTGAGMLAVVDVYKSTLLALELTDDQLAKLEVAVAKVEALVDPAQYKKDAKSFVTGFRSGNQALVPDVLELLRKFDPAALTEFIRNVNRNVAATLAATEAANPEE